MSTLALRTTPLALVLAAGLCVAPTATAAPDPDELPISRITLYRSGVGSFLRQGFVEGDTDVDLRFRTDQVNDILKSMVVMDLDGGRIEGATYGSKEPLSRRLASFAINIADNPSRAELFERLRGAPVRVRTAEGEREGHVLSVEAQSGTTPEGGSITRHIVTIVTDQGLWSAEVDRILNFEILDQNLAAELRKALQAVAEHRADNVKTLDLAFRGEGQREVFVGYVHEAPVWKTSYRLVMAPETDTGFTLQGWAIVENTTEEDWEDVRLSLVSGQPVSFTMDLYEPVFVERPEVPVPTGAGARPRTYSAGQAPAPELAFQAPSAARRAAGLADRGAREEDASGLARSKSFGEVMASSVAAAASGEDVGEVFQFTLDAPITVGRQQSAMLPIIATAIEGERVSIYNQADGVDHPMRGVRLGNDTGLQLMPGPIAVYDGEAYAGDAQIGHVSRGDDRLLAYAVDLDVESRVESTGNSTVQNVRIVNGLIQQRTIDRQATRYFFESNDERRARTLVVEHNKLSGWELVNTPEPQEVTDGLYRFELEIAAGGDARLEVTQERTRYENLELLRFDLATLLRYSREGKVSDEVVDAFREAQRLQALVFESERELARLEQERNEISQDQNRIRQNMGAIDRNSDLYATYMQKLTQQETRLEEIRTAIESAQQSRDQRQRELERYIRDLDVE